MDTLNAMLQDLVYQVRRAQTPTSTGQRQQAATDLSDSPPRGDPDRFLLNFVGVAEGYWATPFASSQAFGPGLGALRKRGSIASAMGIRIRTRRGSAFCVLVSSCCPHKPS